MATILVIEDEDAVREMLQITLEQSGFRVLVASGGSEALDLCESAAEPIDLVLTDIVMPGTSGVDLAGYLAIRFPWLRTVRMSGFTEAMLNESGMRRDDSPFLQTVWKSGTAGNAGRRVRRGNAYLRVMI